MREKSSKITDFACLGRSTDRFERNLMEIAGVLYRIRIRAQKNNLSEEEFILKEFAGKFGTYFFHIFRPYADTE